MRRRSARIATAVVALSLAGIAAAGPALAAARDTDGDGMPDRWEKAHGLDWRKANAKADPDRDGVSNLREFRLGQDPRQANATCSAIEIALGATDPSQCGSTSVTQLLR